MRLIDADNDKFAETLENITRSRWFESWRDISFLLTGQDCEKYAPTFELKDILRYIYNNYIDWSGYGDSDEWVERVLKEYNEEE